MHLAVLVIAVHHKGVANVAVVAVVVNGPVAHVINGAAVVDLVIHHVIPCLLIVGIIGLLHILDIGIVVEVGDHATEDIPQQGVTALTRVDGVEGNTDLINQF